MAGICTSPYPSLYPIEKVGSSSYPYPYSVNAEILYQNGDEFEQYPRRRVYLPSLTKRSLRRLYIPLRTIFNKKYVMDLLKN